MIVLFAFIYRTSCEKTRYIVEMHVKICDECGLFSVLTRQDDQYFQIGILL